MTCNNQTWQGCRLACHYLSHHHGTLSFLVFLLYMNGLPDKVICNIAINADDVIVYFKCDQTSDLWQQLELVSELESDLQDTVEWGRKWLVDFNAWNTQLVSFGPQLLLMWKWMGLFLRKDHHLRCWGCLLNWIGAIIFSIAKTASKTIRALIRSMKFLSPEDALYLYKSAIQPSMEYYCHVWAGAPSCYLEFLDKPPNGYVGMLVLYLLPLLNSWLIIDQ